MGAATLESVFWRLEADMLKCKTRQRQNLQAVTAVGVRVDEEIVNFPFYRDLNTFIYSR